MNSIATFGQRERKELFITTSREISLPEAMSIITLASASFISTQRRHM